MSVLIHPTLANGRNAAVLQQMQFKHGLRASPTGHFVLPNGEHPPMRTKKPARKVVVDHGPFGGDAA